MKSKLKGFSRKELRFFTELVDYKKKIIKLHTWSKATLGICEIDLEHLDREYPFEKAGIWIDCLYSNKITVHNDYENAPNKKGIPEGHVFLKRDLAVPILENNEPVAIIGLGNKEEHYNKIDIAIMGFIATNLWSIILRKRTEDELKSETEYIKLLMDTSPSAIIQVDFEGNIIFANSKALDLFNLDENKIEKRMYNPRNWNFLSLTDSDSLFDKEIVYDIIKRTKKPAYDIRHAIKLADGRIVYISVNGSPLLDSNGNFDGLVATVHDITEKIETKKKLLESERKFQLLFEKINEAFSLNEIILDEQGKPVDYIIHDLNKTFEEMMGLEKEEIVGKKITEIFPDIASDENDWISKFGNIALNNKEITFENYCKYIDKWISVNAFCPKKFFFAATFLDITNRKRNELQLNEYRENLEELVTERTRDLIHAKNKLEEMNEKLVESIDKEKRLAKIKDDFITNINHEIRTPLTSILMNSQYLIKRAEKLSRDKLVHKVENLESSTKALLKLINEILDFSNIESGEFSYKKNQIEVDRFFFDLNEAFKFLYQRKGIELHFISLEKLSLESDYSHLFKIFNHLLFNALKFTEDGKVEVLCSQHDDNLEFIVKDTGCGIDENQLESIFDKFSQGQLDNTKASGTGIGLYIVQKLVQLHGGNISVQSKLGVGSEFKVILPVKSNWLKAP